IIASIPACKNSSVVNTAHKGANVNILAERDSVFLAMINEEVVTAAEEKQYITNTTELISLHPLACDSMSIHYREVINEDTIELRIRLKPFVPDEYDISYHEENANQIKLIDGKDPWGAFYQLPLTSIDTVALVINGRRIPIADQLQDLYDVNMCGATHFKENFSPSPALKYDESNEAYYLYIDGGNAANCYFSKTVFSRSQYITRYVVHYGQLSESSAFKPYFKGF
ncbi:MAG: hypothetical protein AAFR36_06965, partial [Bacteroidota bacterium]